MLNGFGDVEAQAPRGRSPGVMRWRYHGADMSKMPLADIEDMMKFAASAEFGGVDILVNNAGIQHVARSGFFRSSAGTPSSPSTSPAPSTPRAWPAGHEGAPTGGASSTWPSVHGLVARRRSRPMWRPNTASSADQGDGAGERHHRRDLQRHLPGLGDALVQKQVDAKAAQGVPTPSRQEGAAGREEPSMQFTTPEELGELAGVLLPAGNNVRGVAWNMDGGWAAQ